MASILCRPQCVKSISSPNFIQTWLGSIGSKLLWPGPRFNVNTIFPGMEISIIKIKQLWDTNAVNFAVDPSLYFLDEFYSCPVSTVFTLWTHLMICVEHNPRILWKEKYSEIEFVYYWNISFINCYSALYHDIIIFCGRHSDPNAITYIKLMG